MVHASQWPFRSKRLAPAALVLFLVLPCVAQSTHFSEADLPALLKRMQINMTANERLAQQFTSDERWRNRTSFKEGSWGSDHTARFENMFVEGLPYRRKVEAGGKPLSAEEAAAEQKRLDQTAAERRAMTLEEKKKLFHWDYHSSLPLCCLATLFENRIVRQEEIGGREVVVVESQAMSNAKPATAEEKSSVDWKETTWIDLEDAMPSRVEAELLKGQEHFEKGMTVHIDFVRWAGPAATKGAAPQGVWLQGYSVSHFRFWTPLNKGFGITEKTWSNFKRFQVDVRLLEEPVEEMPVAKTH
jgi:hypothetical protein